MATTTNYGWDTPDDTDLVKDGAAAIRTLGSSVDTTTKALNPSTTEGDIEYRSATANTNTRLAIGTAGQVLAVNSGATAPEWVTSTSGGMTLLSTTTLSGATVTISSIDQTYKNLLIFISGVTNATADGFFRIAPNASTSITTTIRSFNLDYAGGATQDGYWDIARGPSPTRTSSTNSFACTIYDYASTTSRKSVTHNGGYVSASYGSTAVSTSGYIDTTSAISSLVFSNSGGNLSTGTVLIYGVK
jgi:hypothetical protein